MKWTQDIGIDLGTTTVLVYIKNKGIVLEEPSIVAIEKGTDKVIAIGHEAKKMLGRAPENIEVIRPLKDGVISDYAIAEKMIKYFIDKVSEAKVINPKVVVCVPSGATELEKKAVIDATIHAGARKVYIIEEPLAAAIGAGIDISRPNGNMVIDIGGGTTDIAIVSLGGIVKKKSIKVAGDKFNEDIIKKVKQRYNVIIGEATAEEIKENIGSAYRKPNTETYCIKGRHNITGMPIEIRINSEDVYDALNDSVLQIVQEVKDILETLPPELATDISNNGIVITGGGGLIYGLDKLIEEHTGLQVMVADNSTKCVAYGTGKTLDNIALLENGGFIKGNRKMRK